MGDAADDVYDAMLNRLADQDDDIGDDGWVWICKKGAACSCAVKDDQCPHCELEPQEAPF